MIADAYYRDALKKGKKSKRQCMNMGIYPYLPALDNLLTREQQSFGVNVGIHAIPTEFIVGTRTTARATAFSRDFLPLMEEETEFAEKWKSLCSFHLEEGICDAIKVYEYMNRFYVEEGNKRVSLLKLFDAVDVQAEVIRILPEKTEQPNVVSYYELLDFYKYSKINNLEFSNPGCYEQLQRYIGKNQGEIWNEKERIQFRSTFYFFKRAVKSLKGEVSGITMGDVLLTYLKIYGYKDLREKNEDEIKQSLNKIWEEVLLINEEENIELKIHPSIEPPKSRFSIITRENNLKIDKVAFVYDKNPNTSGWVYGHELGRMHLERVFGNKLATNVYEDAMDVDPNGVIEQAIKDGNQVIFTTSAKFLPICISMAVKHPEVWIFNCSLNKAHRYICTYYARMYEVKFIIGAIAGAMTKNDKIGYLCDYPIYGQIAGINAFALGVQMVNPDAKVYLEWSCIDGAENAEKRLKEKEISIISSQDMARFDEGIRGSFGLYTFEGEKKKNLAMPIWHWGVYYEKLLQSISNRTLQTEYKSSKKALNFYWGMSADVVEVLCSNHLPESVKKLVGLLKKSICDDMFEPFQGIIYTQDGKMIEGKKQQLSMSEIIQIDWLVDNIEGSIPEYQKLNEEGKATVDSAGAPSIMQEL